AFPQQGYGENVNAACDCRDHDAAFAADRDVQRITHGQPPVQAAAPSAPANTIAAGETGQGPLGGTARRPAVDVGCNRESCRFPARADPAERSGQSPGSHLAIQGSSRFSNLSFRAVKAALSA